MIQSSARNSILGIMGGSNLAQAATIQVWVDPIYRNTRNEASQLSLFCDNKWRSRTISSYRISSIRRRGYSLHVSVRLLFEGGVYFIGKPAGINDGWIRYVRAIQQRLLDAGSSTRNLSIQVSAMEKSCTARTALALARWPSSELFECVCVSRVYIVAVATIRGRSLVEEMRYCIDVLLWRLYDFCCYRSCYRLYVPRTSLLES